MAKNKIKLFCVLFTFVCTCSAFADPVRDKVEQIYTAEIGVREKTGNNDGERIEMYLKSTGLGKGYAWCAAFVTWTFQQAGIKTVRSAYSPDWFKKNVVYIRGETKQYIAKKGDVFGLYFPEKKRIAHVGFIHSQEGDYYITVEGNTNQAGSREGDGVYKKRRPKRTIYKVADYITTKIIKS